MTYAIVIFKIVVAKSELALLAKNTFASITLHSTRRTGKFFVFASTIRTNSVNDTEIKFARLAKICVFTLQRMLFLVNRAKIFF